jgi:hypothetical protein
MIILNILPIDLLGNLCRAINRHGKRESQDFHKKAGLGYLMFITMTSLSSYTLHNLKENINKKNKNKNSSSIFQILQT